MNGSGTLNSVVIFPIFVIRRSDRLHDPNNVLILTDAQFELCNLLYNLACIHAQIGSELPRDTDEVSIITLVEAVVIACNINIFSFLRESRRRSLTLAMQRILCKC